jgi:UPF0176 protein
MEKDSAHELEQAVVLFYHYFASSKYDDNDEHAYQAWWKDPKRSVETLRDHQTRLCKELNLTGRILIAEEGINGTVAGNKKSVEQYMNKMKDYNHEQERQTAFSTIEDDDCDGDVKQTKRKRPSEGERFFENVDWKTSFVKGEVMGGEKSTTAKPKLLFPDLKICVVKEIVSTGGLVDVQDIPAETGKHLSPDEFHAILTSYANGENHGNDQQTVSNQRPPIALIDARNTFEHNIGHFINPQTGEKAMDPEMTTFSSFDKFCQQHADDLKDKQVLMYCTGACVAEENSSIATPCLIVVSLSFL